METQNNEPPRKLFSFRFILLGCFLLVLSYAIFDRTIPVKTNSVTVLNHPLPGEDLIIQLDVDRQKLCYTKVEKAVFDGINSKFNLPSQSFQIIGNEGRDVYSIRVPIDEDANPGPSVVRVVSVWVCNYVHIVWPIVILNDIPFEIGQTVN